MFNYLFLLFISSYTLDIFTKSYKEENTFSEMKEFIYTCQKREDKLREQCDLKMYRIPTEQTIFENVFDKYHISKNYYLVNKIKADNYNHFIDLSYDKYNVGSIISFEDTDYTLIREGIKRLNYYENMKDPFWSIDINGYTHTINRVNIQKLPNI